MKIARIPHYVKRAQELGTKKTLEMIAHRVQISYFEQYSRYQAEQKKASYTWCTLATKSNEKDFNAFLASLRSRSLVVIADIYQKECKQEMLLSQANAFAYNCFDILGSREQCLMSLPWHADFRLRYQNPEADYLFDKRMFYKDFQLPFGLTDRLTKDIKVPWELARFQHLFVMGAAFQKTHDEVYSRAFVQQVMDFLDENPFLLGPNWVCPMDVGIRALNWVWAFHFFKHAHDIPAAFWERFVCSLYDHLYYLEHNWELFGVTSNHYLSDLIGYFYVTWFFQDLHGVKEKHAWCFKELLKEFEVQVFEEGTDYEGSTSYHGLVTEIFYHFYMLSQESGFSIPQHVLEKLQRMFSFIDWMSPTSVDMVKIGDDDSGKILYFGITESLVDSMRAERHNTQIYFKDFGVSAYKTDLMHVTLRHHAYTKEQPSGHFHNDIGSITYAYKGIPVIVDPGSYVYTPSAVWRNTFRSTTAHNNFFIADVEPIMFSEASLFVLDIPEKDTIDQIWHVQNSLYSIECSRNVHFLSDTSIILIDKWKEASMQNLISVWNFMLAPEIVPQIIQEGIMLMYQQKSLVRITSDSLKFSIYDAWYAPEYGVKVPCKQLRATSSVTSQPVSITITGL